MKSERLAQIALHFVDGIGSKTAKQLINFYGSAYNIFSQSKKQLLKLSGIGSKLANNICSEEPFKKAESEIIKCQNQGVKIIVYTDDEYPKRLKMTEDAPILLFSKGNINYNHEKSVAIVGTRKATSYGKKITQRIITELAEYNPIIISGLAYGIDSYAHQFALDNNLKTASVMATGIDIIYPSINKGLSKMIINQGALLTENNMGVTPNPMRFPNRNRIIAGMSDLVIVIEAAKKGGALITAKIAHGYNRDVFSVPGDLGNTYSEGCNNLIKSNIAHLLTSANDIAYTMNWDNNKTVKKLTQLNLDNLDDGEKIIIDTITKFNPNVHLDVLSRELSLSIGQISAILLSLELKGYISSLPGKLYKVNN